MHPRTLAMLAAALVLAGGLAGCAEPAPTIAPESDEPVVITDLDDVESLENQTFNQERHLHDYWDGQDRLLVLDETRDDGTFFFSDEWRSIFQPPAGQVVPQGTSAVEVTLSWTDTDGDTYSDPELWVQSPAESEPRLVGPIESGQTLAVTTTEADADLPHQTLSAWQFELRLHPGTPAGLIWFRGTITMHVGAIRGLEIPVYPPHPDLWNEREEIPLLDDQVGLGMWGGNAEGDYSCYGACPQVHAPDDGIIVPYDAALVEVILDVSAESITTPGLSYHGADTREWTRLTPDETDGTRHIYRIPVTPLKGDGPYAAQSQWRFLPYAAEPDEDGLWAAGYTLTARALRTA